MKAIAYFNNKYGISGSIKLHQKDKKSNTNFRLDLSGFNPKKEHAIHIHEYGNISGGCMSTGGHYNPYNKNHGNYIINGKNRHVGDLVNNIMSDVYGNVKLNFEDDLVKLMGKYSVIGRTIVIHSGIDDLGLGDNIESLKTGNAGGRMACAIIGIDKE